MTALTVACLVGIILLMVVFARCDDGPAVVKASCVAVEELTVVDYDCKVVKTGEHAFTTTGCKRRDERDWQVTCKVTRGGETLWEGQPPMAHPATRKEAFKAMEEFLDKKAKDVVKKETKP